MKKNANTLFRTAQQSQSLRFITSALILIFILCQASFAQEAAKDKSLKSYKLPSNLKKHLQDKYKDKDNKDQIEEISSTLRETPLGPKGRLHLSGHIKPKNYEAASGETSERARAMAMDFLKDESELLGLSDLNELRETKIKTTRGHDGEYTDIYYDRYIDDIPFENGQVHIVIGPDESIQYVDASLIPAPSELYQAVTKTMITEGDVLKIVERNLRAHGSDPNTMKVLHSRKVAIEKSPYVVWTLDVLVKQKKVERWKYTINVFTSDVIRKSNAIIVD